VAVEETRPWMQITYAMPAARKSLSRSIYRQATIKNLWKTARFAVVLTLSTSRSMKMETPRHGPNQNRITIKVAKLNSLFVG